MLFCIQLSFDLIMRLRSIFRLGIRPCDFWYTSRNIISMDTIIYSILPSEKLFHALDCWLNHPHHENLVLFDMAMKSCLRNVNIISLVLAVVLFLFVLIVTSRLPFQNSEGPSVYLLAILPDCHLPWLTTTEPRVRLLERKTGLPPPPPQ